MLTKFTNALGLTNAQAILNHQYLVMLIGVNKQKKKKHF